MVVPQSSHASNETFQCSSNNIMYDVAHCLRLVFLDESAESSLSVSATCGVVQASAKDQTTDLRQSGPCFLRLVPFQKTNVRRLAAHRSARSRPTSQPLSRQHRRCIDRWRRLRSHLSCSSRLQRIFRRPSHRSQPRSISLQRLSQARQHSHHSRLHLGRQRRPRCLHPIQRAERLRSAQVGHRLVRVFCSREHHERWLSACSHPHRVQPDLSSARSLRVTL